MRKLLVVVVDGDLGTSVVAVVVVGIWREWATKVLINVGTVAAWCILTNFPIAVAGLGLWGDVLDVLPVVGVGVELAVVDVVAVMMMLVVFSCVALLWVEISDSEHSGVVGADVHDVDDVGILVGVAGT